MNCETKGRMTTDLLMTIDTTDLNPLERCCAVECRTRAVIYDFYQCQVHRADCGFAVPFGTSYLCMSDLRREYSAQRRQLESIL